MSNNDWNRFPYFCTRDKTYSKIKVEVFMTTIAFHIWHVKMKEQRKLQITHCFSKMHFIMKKYIT